MVESIKSVWFKWFMKVNLQRIKCTYNQQVDYWLVIGKVKHSVDILHLQDGCDGVSFSLIHPSPWWMMRSMGMSSRSARADRSIRHADRTTWCHIWWHARNTVWWSSSISLQTTPPQSWYRTGKCKTLLDLIEIY